jgi:agmatine deiminase
MISDSESNMVFISDQLETRFPTLVNRLQAILTAHQIALRLIRGTKDIWCRDFMPVQVGAHQFIEFRYAPDYLVGFEHLITRPTDIDPIPEVSNRHVSGIVLDGGNIVRCGDRAIVTDKIFRENTGIPKDSLQQMLRTELRINHLIVIPTEPGDPIGHADGMVRFVNPEMVLVNDYSKFAPSFGRRLLSILQKSKLQWSELPYAPELDDTEEIPSAIGCYTNFLMVQGLIILPTFGIPEDQIASRVLVERAPKFAIESINCGDLAQQGGVLNCVMWTIYSESHSHEPLREPASQVPNIENRVPET